MKKRLFRWGAAVSTMALLIGLLAIPAWGQTAEPDLTCPFTQGIIVDLGAQMIRSDLTQADAEVGPIAVSIPAGRYDIYLYSYDPHDGGSPQVQAHEQWLLADRSRVSGVTPSFLSGIIDDLPDAEDFLSQQVNGDVLVPDLTELWARHAFWPTSGDAETYANSIHPVCAAFVPVQEPTGSITVYKVTSEEEFDEVFTFTLDGGDSRSVTADSNDSGVWAPLDAGTYDLAEVPKSGWDFAGYECSLGERALTDTVDAETPFSDIANGVRINLSQGDDVVCRLFNDPTGPPPPTTTTTTTSPLLGSIGDFVWNDANTNGVQDAGELGIAGVIVNLLDGSGVLLTSTTTDADGHYRFGGLVAGDYIVEFVLPADTWEFSDADQGADDTVDSDAGVAGRSGIISLAEGAGELTIDAGIHRTTEVEPTTAVRPTEETLPFTGASSGGMGGAAIGLILLGGLVLLAVRGKEDDAVAARLDAK